MVGALTGCAVSAKAVALAISIAVTSKHLPVKG